MNQFLPLLDDRHIEYKMLGQSLLFLPKTLPVVLGIRGYFTNPSELFVLPGTVDTDALSTVSETFEMEDFKLGLPKNLPVIYNRLGASLYLAESEGLNYACCSVVAARLNRVASTVITDS